MNDQVQLKNHFPQLTVPWHPITVARFNGHEVMLAKGQGSYAWHKHEHTDDLFLVLQGRLTLEMRDRSVQLGPGELFVIPKGVEHRPVAEEDTYFMLMEPPETGLRGTTLV